MVGGAAEGRALSYVGWLAEREARYVISRATVDVYRIED